MPRPLLPLAAVLLTLAGCARDAGAGDYPSLGRRPAEAQGFAEPATPPPAPVAADPVLDARLAAMRTRLATITVGATRDAASAERAGNAAKGHAVGSEAWLAAQSALATLDDWRAQVTALGSEADELAIERAAKLDPDYDALTAIRAALRSEIDRQTATIDRLASLTPDA